MLLAVKSVVDNVTRRASGWPLLPSLLFGIGISLLYLYFYAFKAHVALDIKMHAPARAWFKVYWASEDRGFSEKNMQRVLINGTHWRYSMRIGNLGNISKLRIDPVEFETDMDFREITITQPGYAPIVLNADNDFAGLEPLQDIDDVELEDGLLRFETSGRDSQFLFKVNNTLPAPFPLEHLLSVVLILLASVAAGRALGPLQKEMKWVPVLLMVAVALAFTMAMISKHYSWHPSGKARLFIHPDEEVHSVAVEYYSNHNLPPAVDSPLIADTFSIYGFSRLMSHELYYPITGYLTRLLKPFKQPFMTDARIVTLSYLAIMMLLAWRYPAFRPFALPLLLTPQLWYLFSYANSDGFAVFIATIMAYQAASRQSTMQRVLTEKQVPWLGWHLLWLGLLAGVLLLLKLNFYFFILFLGLYLVWRIAVGDFPDKKLLWVRLAIIAAISASVYGGRIVVEYKVNGLDSKEKIIATIEEKAEPLYKPSTELHRKHIYLYMRDRGWTIRDILIGEKWGPKTFVSSFGAYGYTEFLGGNVFYDLVKAVGIALLGVILFSLLVWGPPSSHWLLIITGGCAAGLIGASLYESWTVSFQAQGRYLAPILPMLGVLINAVYPWLMQRTFNALVLVMFALSFYSFVFIGLGFIPKIP